MEELKISLLAVSMAGHDKGRMYAVTGEEEDMYFLCDGRLRTLENPKKKKKKHVQVIRHIPASFGEWPANVRQDSDLIYLLKTYRKMKEDACRNQMS